VSVNGQQTKLNPKDADVPFFSGQMDAPDNAKYKVTESIVIHRGVGAGTGSFTL
jgi:hypothetical protein